MEKTSIENRIRELKTQLNEIVNNIEIERQESKEDEQSILNELLGQKSILEEEIQGLESTLCDIKVNKNKVVSYNLKKEGKKLNVTIVQDSMVDSTKGLISDKSPLAKALKVARVGELFKISTPAGDSEYLLVSKK